MSAQQIIEKISQNQADQALIVVVLIMSLSLIQISPLKINPWTRIGELLSLFLNYIGRELTKDLSDRMDTMEKTTKELDKKIDQTNFQVKQLDNKIDQNRIKEIRGKILDFSHSLDNELNELTIEGRDKEDFDFIYKIHEEYENLLELHNLKNGKTDRAMSNIDYHYNKILHHSE